MEKNMTPKALTHFSSPRLLAALVAAACGFGAAAVQAQQVFRIVGPDGRVTFSDKPPAEPTAKATAGSGAAAGVSGAASLPFELRQVASKYPVTLYTSNDCGPCGTARAMLTGRGVPFIEKTVNSNEDIQALQRLSGENGLPFATIGGQQLKGYSDVEWTQFLDAAGYPKSSILPPSYRPPAATPLVAVAQVPATNAQAEGRAASRANPAAAAAPAPVAPAPSPSNPAGIRF